MCRKHENKRVRKRWTTQQSIICEEKQQYNVVVVFVVFFWGGRLFVCLFFMQFMQIRFLRMQYTLPLLHGTPYSLIPFHLLPYRFISRIDRKLTYPWQIMLCSGPPVVLLFLATCGIVQSQGGSQVWCVQVFVFDQSKEVMVEGLASDCLLLLHSLLYRRWGRIKSGDCALEYNVDIYKAVICFVSQHRT